MQAETVVQEWKRRDEVGVQECNTMEGPLNQGGYPNPQWQKLDRGQAPQM